MALLGVPLQAIAFLDNGIDSLAMFFNNLPNIFQWRINMFPSQPHPVSNGIAFTVSVDYVKHDCVVSADALSRLAENAIADPNLMQTFLAHEANIQGIARRLVAAGVPGTPLRLDLKNFGYN